MFAGYGMYWIFSRVIDLSSMIVVEPPGYTEFLGLMAKASLVLTDPGGIQEETTVLGVLCVTLRTNTERPVTLEIGTNHLAGVKKLSIIAAVRQARSSNSAKPTLPPLWDGQAAVRIIDVIERSPVQGGNISSFGNSSEYAEARMFASERARTGR